MKVVIAVHHFPPHYNGGAEWRAYRTANALQKRGNEVRVVAVESINGGPVDGGPDDVRRGLQGNPTQQMGWIDDVYEGVQVRRLYFNRSLVPDPFRWGYDNPWIGDHLQGLLSSERPDVFHLIGGYLVSGSVLRAACNVRVPSVVTLTDFWFLCPRISMLRSNGRVSSLPINPATCARCLGEEQRRYRIPGQLLPQVMDFYWSFQQKRVEAVQARLSFLMDALNTAAVVISPSQFLRQVFIDAGVCPDRIVFSRQGRDFPNLRPEMLEKSASGHLRVGYLGQITYIKGLHLLIEAARQLPQAPLEVHIYGDPTPFPDYAKRLQRMGEGDERITLDGAYGRGEISEVLKNLDVVVMPSLWYENSPNVILEAFAHRTPVIASNLGGMAELVQDGENGLLFEPGNAADLARQIQRLIVEPGLLAHLKAGIPPVRSTQEEMDDLERIYRQAAVQSR